MYTDEKIQTKSREIGSFLKKKREEKNISKYRVCKDLQICERQLNTIEDGSGCHIFSVIRYDDYLNSGLF